VFYRVQVGEGETVDVIARRFGVRRESVIWNNEATVGDGEPLKGSLLAIPSVDGIIHEIRPGETLAEIASRFGVEVQAIIDFPSNAINSPTAVPSGTILVPGGRKP
jgi:spore germination protein